MESSSLIKNMETYEAYSIYKVLPNTKMSTLKVRQMNQEKEVHW